MKSWSLTFATQMLFRRSGSELFDTFKNIILLNISTIKYLLMKNDEFQENLSRPGVIDAKARRLRNTSVEKALAEPSARGPTSVEY